MSIYICIHTFKRIQILLVPVSCIHIACQGKCVCTTYVNVFVCACIYLCAYMYVFMLHTCIGIHMYIYIYIYICIHVYIYTHTYMYIHIYTCA